MIVGLYDYDFMTYHHVPFNLELMKLATYFRQNKTIAKLTRDFMPDKFSKYYYRKDYNDGFFDPRINQENIKSGGFAFSKNIYVPLDLAVEKCKPDTSIYDAVKDVFITSQGYEERFAVMSRANHIRLSLDGKNIQRNWDQQLIHNNKAKQCVMFHDYNLNAIEGLRDIFVYFHNRYPVYEIFYGNKFPIQCYKPIDVIKWCNVKVMTDNFIIQYNGVMDDRTIYDFLQHQARTSINKQFIYNITYGCASLEEFIKKRFVQIFKQCTYIKIHRQYVNLIYDKMIITDERWQKIIDILNHFVNTISDFDIDDDYLKRYNIWDWVNRLKWHIIFFQNFKFQIEEIYELMNYLQYSYPEIYFCFTELTNVRLQGDYFVHEKPRRD